MGPSPATTAPSASGMPSSSSSSSSRGSSNSSSSSSKPRAKRSWDPLDYEGPIRSLPQLCQVSVRRTRELFAANEGLRAPPFAAAVELALRLKIGDEYTFTNKRIAAAAAQPVPEKASGTECQPMLQQGEKRQAIEDSSEASASSATAAATTAAAGGEGPPPPGAQLPLGASLSEMIHALSPLAGSTAVPLGAAAGGVSEGGSSKAAATGGGGGAAAAVVPLGLSSGELVGLRLRQVLEPLKPQWHAPWKLQRVISGHLGWVNCVSVDPTNNFFATGSNDRLLKIWDLATGQLKLSLTGHVSSLRDIQISDRHPYLFSCGEDGRVKCWDLEQNRVVRDYHGHLSGVYTLALHPSLDILCSGGRDAVVRLWDLSAGKCQATLTNHKKSVRSLAIHPTEYSFVTCGADRVKVWRSPLGVFERNVEGLNAIPNCCAIRSEGDKSSLVVGSNNGQLHFWDWKSGYKYQTLQSRVQPGSLESENGIFCCTFDRSETRLITGECDKTIKIWKMDEDATEETHPISWRHGRDARKALAF
ncbi:pre-mRNA-splicing factor prp46 [Cyclospora cayetanensis]|uniref:Pre-mRNA-splicing factor prp46 n=1 Tax=Cyclospora cayetanensis TaxID=88456 RepID=A0A6P6RWT0_9EIME|nr:pre-mRNA-splicing factor prp46 [Cyclospora cayetanensis]